MELLSDAVNTITNLLRLGTQATPGNRPEDSGSNALNDILRDRKAKFLAELEAGINDWIVVTGNEAGDLDSIASAIGYATLSSEPKIIPLVQTPRDSLYLRPENLLAFSFASLDSSVILTSDDIPPAPKAQPSRFTLVDHNSLLPSLKGDVVAVLDHHEDEKKYMDANPRVIKPVGSCSSLVTVQFTDIWKKESSDHLHSVAMLLLSAILIDTGGLKSGGKAVPTDYEAARLLGPHTGLATASYMANIEGKVPPELNQLSRQLAKAKSSVDSLSIKDLLRRDYKEYVISDIRVGLSTVPAGLKPLVKRDSSKFWNDIDSWMKDQRLDVLGVLTTYRSAKRQKHRRQLLFIVEPGHSDVEDKLFKGIGSDAELQCEERRIAGMGSRRARCWRQNNVKATRKAVAPLVKRLLETNSQSSN